MKHLLEDVCAGSSEIPASAGTATVIAASAAGVASSVNVRRRMVSMPPGSGCAALLTVTGEIARRSGVASSADVLGLARGQSRPHRGDPHRALDRAVALLAHDVQRAVLDLLVDAADVLADHAERDQLDAADQQ